MLETLDFTIRIGSTPTFLYFDLYLYSAYAAHYVYFIIVEAPFCLLSLEWYHHRYRESISCGFMLQPSWWSSYQTSSCLHWHQTSTGCRECWSLWWRQNTGEILRIVCSWAQLIFFIKSFYFVGFRKIAFDLPSKRSVSPSTRRQRSN